MDTMDGSWADIALYLVKEYPDMVPEQSKSNSKQTSLEILATKSKAFRSGSSFGFWQRIIYSCEYFSHDIVFIYSYSGFLFLMETRFDISYLLFDNECKGIPVNREKALESPVEKTPQLITTQNPIKGLNTYILHQCQSELQLSL